ncbi:hypothetical protein DL96DRAFT_1625148 [Flagelloscypha sp. PMI_526]|nr:hypothetical protein DL96DRAFT_1625148 [Flagelloscypha sp. PMI_526]
MWTWLGHECFPSLSHLAVVHNDDGDLCNAAQDCVDLLKNLPDQVQVCALMFVPSHNLVSVMDQNTIELSDGTVDPRVVVITSTPKVIGSPLGYVMTFNPEDPAVIGLESTENDIFKAAQHTIKMRRINGRYPKASSISHATVLLINRISLFRSIIHSTLGILMADRLFHAQVKRDIQTLYNSFLLNMMSTLNLVTVRDVLLFHGHARRDMPML